ncbi:MAG: biotin--[acetyl-CoA-carboxylase] ligase [Acidobacteria bacterium]|jgi:BirA family transcriptional regulator, biotin operon repressor / biotin---[acetyl-CoA-carboxylase] ligase|nr:MAG: biotin--[acetyl-CoA-carboxylase] ligase [Acidobacteriota bacterium]
MNNATVIVSGTKLAQEIKSNRAEVWRLVQKLRAYGVDIAGRPATGYRLRSMPDLVLPDLIDPMIKGTIFSKQVHHFFSIGSTNTAAMEAGAAGAPEGSVFLAEEQTAGRGRAAHSWHSAQGSGIYCSVLLRPSLPPSEVLLLSLAAALAVRSAIAEIQSAFAPDLKWPNDLMLGEKKVCGILTEMNAEPTRVRYLVIGIGINVNQASFPPALQGQATSLRMATGSEWSRVELCAALLKSLHREYAEFVRSPASRSAIVQRFSANSPMVRGRAVRVEENGEFEGTTDGLDERGFLRVRTANVLLTVMSGTVRLR